ncbi:MAG: hypothetical protein WAT12_09230 [Candidatus Nitrotoga sp.]
MKYRLHRAVTGEHFDNIIFCESRLPGLGADYLNEFEAVMAHICTAPNFYPTIATPRYSQSRLKAFPLSYHLPRDAHANHRACRGAPAPPPRLLDRAISEMMTPGVGWAGFICPRGYESGWAQRRAHPAGLEA